MDDGDDCCHDNHASSVPEFSSNTNPTLLMKLLSVFNFLLLTLERTGGRPEKIFHFFVFISRESSDNLKHVVKIINNIERMEITLHRDRK